MSHEEPPDKHHGWSDAALDARPVVGHRALRRLGWALVVVLTLALLVVLPPLINVGRYQHRIAQAISADIGRPVHFDDIQVHLLPLPGLTIQNFVMQEDPAFGVEPAMRANTVEARLRLSSLWRRRIEISRIDLQAPSINLVRRADGRWNFQGVVTQAGTISSAPTAQRRAGGQPRFPYIEASEARINVKLAETKLPWSLVDADLALWLPESTEWRIRLRGRPVRTDTDVSDVGELHVEGSLGRDTTGQAAGLMLQPLALSVRWASTPLGEAAKLLLGRDTGFRGAASAEVEVRGTPARMQLSTDLHLHNLRRAEFVPRLPMSLNAHCIATADSDSHALQSVRCAVPTAQSAGLFDGMFRSDDVQVMNAPNVLAIQAEVPDVLEPATARATAVLQRSNPAYVLDWLRVASSRIPEGVAATGDFSLRMGWNVPASGADTSLSEAGPHADLAPGSTAESGTRNWFLHAACTCTLVPPYAPNVTTQSAIQNSAQQTGTATSLRPDGGAPQEGGRQPGEPTGANAPWSITLNQAAPAAATPAGSAEAGGHVLAIEAFQTVAATPGAALSSADSAALPAAQVRPGTRISGTLSRTGFGASYDTVSLARYAASLLPPLGDDLPGADAAAPAPGPAISSARVWGQRQRWTQTAVPNKAPLVRRQRKHR